MKRVIAGLFLLIALGALGLILAGALTSGEQLVVRFLTAVIVAAIGLYVISDLRLQADDDAVATGSRPLPVSRPLASPPTEPPAAPAPAPAFMPTVTGKRGSLFGPPADTGTVPATGPATGSLTLTDLSGPLDPTLSLAAEATTAANLRILGGPADDPAGLDPTIDRPELARAEERLRAVARPVAADIDDTLTSSYLEEDHIATEWPPVTGAVPVTVAPLPDASAAGAPVGRPDRITTGELESLVDLDPETEDRTRQLTLAGLRRPPSVVPREALVTTPAPSPAPSSPFGRLNATGVSGVSLAGLSGVGLLERPAPTAPSSPITAAPITAAPITAAPSSTVPTSTVPTSTVPTSTVPSTIAAASYARAPLADVIDLCPQRTSSTPEIESAIRAGEIEVIASLISQGRLTTEGPITDRDVRTMVYVAFTSSELRKLLLAGGTIDGDNSSIDLGEVEVFHRGQPATPAALGDGIPAEPSRSAV